MAFLVAIVSGFAGGVWVRSLFFTSWWPVLFVVMLAMMVGAFAFLKPRLASSLGAVFCLCVALGMVRLSITDTPLPQTFVADLKHRVSYDGIVVSDPDVRDANQRVEIEVTRGDESTIVLAVAPRNPIVAVGDKVFVSGTLAIPEPFADNPPSPNGSGEAGNGRVFKYDKYLQRDGVRFILNFAYLRVESHSPWYSISANLAKIKHAFLGGIAATLPEPHASLAGGVVIGGKSGLGTDLKDDFVRSGLVQIIVLSGYNVMIVASWVMEFFAFFNVSRRKSSIAGAIALLLFVGIAGFSATAIRAMVMALIALYARATGRTYVAGRALFFVILLMLIWNPLYLVFDPGFGLSVVATAGLIWLAPVIETLLASKWRKVFESVPSAAKRNALKNFSPERANSFWTNAVATTLSAQIAVLPLLLYDTGNLSLVAIPANLIVMPFVPLAMGFSIVAGFAGMMFGSFAPIIGIVLAYPAYLANAFLIFIAHESASLTYSAFMLPPFPFWLVLATYSGLIYFAKSKRFSTTDQFKFAKKASI